MALLIDWGLRKFVVELQQMASQDARSGTWPFISAVLLAFPKRLKYEVWHDLESFIHVLHWMCFRFQKTIDSNSPATSSESIQELYGAYKFQNGKYLGGRHKLEFLRAGIVPFRLRGGSSMQPDKTNGLHQLLTALADLYGEHYQLLAPISDKPEPLKAEERGVVYKNKPSFAEAPGKRVTARSIHRLLE
ncbi:hypothetical protein FOMPIDRAFT_84436 [Fomitopsis schrenkii]|uniref:Fungal-type protein kinase domain-containing protein n=1 Tax=Fomitopsis schrenkii TaxID=2126942 RepID=S8E279_FOMSC|nr:hypothetical protein FOMPIDRAFT_84436 [Fomitopsis schrenkii]